jgi:hypothetical protein
MTDLDLSHHDLARLPLVIELPAIKFLKISHNPHFSDGVWDVIFPRCLKDLALSATSAMEFAYLLRNTA